MTTTAELTSQLQSVEEQRELFLWKYRDVDRAEVNELLKDFKKHDTTNKGALDYHEALVLLERRGTVKTAKELMDWVGGVDRDKNNLISFVEWCCAFYNKSYDELFTFVDEEAKQRALEEARIFGEEARKAELEIERAKQQKELQAQLRAAALERESKLTGVAGMKAFFARKADDVSQSAAAGKSNEQQIKEEAARRRALREAKSKMNEAILNANKVKTAEEIAKEVQIASEKVAAEEAAALKRQEDEEKAARAARKAALNAKWGGANNTSNNSLK